MITYAYELVDFRRWAGGLRHLLRQPVGAGQLYTGVTWLVIDVTLRDDVTFVILPSPSPAILLQFDLGTNHPMLLLSSTGHGQEYGHLRNTRIKKIALLITPGFFRHLKKEIRIDLLHRAGRMPHPNTEPIPCDYRPLLEDIFHADKASPLRHLLLHNRLLSLAEKFLYSFVHKTPQPQPGSIHWAKPKEKDVDALRDVMKMLSDSQLPKFPSIDALSKTAMMSSTKLKTRFKQIYGMKLYEFYNHHRLLHAREMLRTGHYSVKEVGISIGFSNLSNFAKAFKKEFGALPREIIKSK